MGSFRSRVVLIAIALIISTGLIVLVSSRGQKGDGHQSAGGEKALHTASALVQHKIRSAPVVIFSKSYCPYCMGVKKLFTEMGQQFQAVELDQLGTRNEMVG